MVVMVCRMKLLDSPATDEEIENKLDAQLEQLIKQCNDELSLIPKMAGIAESPCVQYSPDLADAMFANLASTIDARLSKNGTCKMY